MITSSNRWPRPIVALIAGVMAIASLLATPAQATPSQGSATGVLYISEISSNTIWLGDISNPPAPLTAFWTEAGAQPDQVATTLTSVAWSSYYAESGPLFNKVKIAPIARTASNVVTVNLPANAKSLAADRTNDRILMVVEDKIMSVKTDGTDLRTIVTDPNLAGGADAGVWSLALDEINHKIYSTTEEEGTAKIVEYTVDTAHLVEQSRRVVYEGFYAVDGLGVDPISQTLYWTRYDGDAVGRGTVDGNDTSTMLAEAGTAPTGSVVSNATGKLYFTTENSVQEIEIANPGTARQLYTGTQSSDGFQGLAIAFGVTLPAAAEYTLTYSANVPSGKTSTGSVPTSQEYTEGETAGVSRNVNNLAVAGYTFTGWNTKADGTGLEFPRWDEQTEDYIRTFTITADTTLYAQWGKLTVTRSAGKFNVKVDGSQSSSYRYVKVTDGTNTGYKWLDYSSNESTASINIGDELENEGPGITMACDVQYTFSYVDWTNYEDGQDESEVTSSFVITIPCAAEAVVKTFKMRVFFAAGSAALRPAAMSALRALANQIKAMDSVTSIKVVGFVQPSGSKANDASLSRARAVAVQKALKKFGVTAKITVSGKGRIPADSPLSRRAVITVTGTVAP